MKLDQAGFEIVTSRTSRKSGPICYVHLESVREVEGCFEAEEESRHLALFGNRCLSAVSMKIISAMFMTVFMSSTMFTSITRRMPAHGSPTCMGSALEATSPTCLNRSNHV